MIHYGDCSVGRGDTTISSPKNVENFLDLWGLPRKTFYNQPSGTPRIT